MLRVFQVKSLVQVWHSQWNSLFCRYQMPIMLVICSQYTKPIVISLYKKKGLKGLESWGIFSVLQWIENLVKRPVSIANTTLNERDVHETTELRAWRPASSSTSRYLKVALPDKCESKLVLYNNSQLAATPAVPLWQESHHVVAAETVVHVSTAGSARPPPPSSDQISVWSHPWSWHNCGYQTSTQSRFRNRNKITFNIT